MKAGVGKRAPRVIPPRHSRPSPTLYHGSFEGLRKGSLAERQSEVQKANVGLESKENAPATRKASGWSASNKRYPTVWKVGACANHNKETLESFWGSVSKSYWRETSDPILKTFEASGKLNLSKATTKPQLSLTTDLLNSVSYTSSLVIGGLHPCWGGY